MVPMERGASACTVALLAALLALVTTSANTPRSPRQGAARTLAPRAFAPVPLGAVRPTGWMKTQLEAQVCISLSCSVSQLHPPLPIARR
jgi:hypothetical protein